MRRTQVAIPALLDQLEEFHGRQEPGWPVDPYEFVIWWQCGYPASDKTCAKGWDKLVSEVGIEPRQLLNATPRQLTSSLKPGGMIPELRGLRLKEIAMRVQDKFGGDLRAALTGTLPMSRKRLKEFPGIADPGADRILLFAGITPIAAVPSNATQVLVRVLDGVESKNYVANYRRSQEAIEAQVARTADARTRAYLLVKRHGQEICKRTKPRCEECPVSAGCTYFGQRSAS